jgi:hypothetical protein
MSDHNTCLTDLSVGDIFHAEYPNGASCICLVSSVEKATIHAKRITTQQNLSFDRQTGIEDAAPDNPQDVIDSLAPIPPEINNVFLGMSKRYETLMSMNEASRFQNFEQHKLTDAEKKALAFVHSHYGLNPAR